MQRERFAGWGKAQVMTNGDMGAGAGEPAPASELAQGPTFASYSCSPTVDERGLPTWIIVEGKQAQRWEKQGNTWYSLRQAEGSYAQVLRIPKGEKPPEVKGV